MGQRAHTGDRSQQRRYGRLVKCYCYRRATRLAAACLLQALEEDSRYGGGGGGGTVRAQARDQMAKWPNDKSALAWTSCCGPLPPRDPPVIPWHSLGNLQPRLSFINLLPRILRLGFGIGFGFAAAFWLPWPPALPCSPGQPTALTASEASPARGGSPCRQPPRLRVETDQSAPQNLHRRVWE